MKIDVEVISREIIKPATSIDHDPIQHYKFSFLDQVYPPTFFPALIYFYSPDDDLKLSNNSEKSSQLKASLSQILKHYYHLAGVIKDNSHIDCSNAGVPFWEAQVNCQLSELLQNPDPAKLINKFLPVVDANNSLLLAIQVNFFNCGGIAIGVRLSHKVADASSFITFINKWAETARGNGDQVVAPDIVGAIVFPPLSDGIEQHEFHTENNIVSKRFVFTNSNIYTLKEKYVVTSSSSTKESGRIYPTRFEALTSFLFSRFVSTVKHTAGTSKKNNYLLKTPVNLRKKIDTPLPNDSFGNISGFALSVIISSQEDTDHKTSYDYGNVCSKLREAVRNVDNHYVKKLISERNFSWYIKEVLQGRDRSELETYTCSSCCSFPVYEADFGWGRPKWVAFGNLFQRNVVYLMDTRNGDGIEAWIRLTEEDMAIFESDKELLTYASPTPHVLKSNL